ncbi:MAG: hypothetical protein ABH824_03465 [Nanoarchaeota archaeon]|nr:hypothetical protein [Nanoarchaeota archaeon]MBU1632217.1 hypothetical protein [Nanoarchaeota archaeon]MBU1875521.1 hypothetical protein [Nanoarchaeota archaeon]
MKELRLMTTRKGIDDIFGTYTAFSEINDLLEEREGRCIYVGSSGNHREYYLQGCLVKNEFYVVGNNNIAHTVIVTGEEDLVNSLVGIIKKNTYYCFFPDVNESGSNNRNPVNKVSPSNQISASNQDNNEPRHVSGFY